MVVHVALFVATVTKPVEPVAVLVIAGSVGLACIVTIQAWASGAWGCLPAAGLHGLGSFLGCYGLVIGLQHQSCQLISGCQVGAKKAVLVLSIGRPVGGHSNEKAFFALHNPEIGNVAKLSNLHRGAR